MAHVITGAILWRRLDAAGHEACRLVQRQGGWDLEGTAAYQHEGAPACLAYKVECDNAWVTRQGHVRGWIGEQPLDITVTRSAQGRWALNGQVIDGLEGCFDLDLGFTPSTNLLQLRRIALGVGDAADVPVAWLDVDAVALDRLQQRYERRAAEIYWYEAPRFDYSGLLQVNGVGFVEKYPDLWETDA